jgi:o-succinylbenzoate synthase
VKLRVDRVVAPLLSRFVSASAALERRELLLVRLESAGGHVGWGEAAPLPSYDGVSLEDCRAALEDCRAELAAGEDGDREALLARCARAAVLPQAVAAVDLALWDLAGRRAGHPVWRLLGAPPPAAIEVNYTVAAPDRAGAAAEAARARAAGYRTIKLKAATGDDAGRLAAVRAAAGPKMAIRLDANGAWSVAEAEAALRALAPAGLELCEEPVSGVDRIAELAKRTAVPLALDETALAPGALERRLCHAVCLKISRCGGITGVIAAARRARRAGYRVYLASTLDGPLGIAAALHAAALLAPDCACGLATLQLFAGREDPLAPAAGRIRVPTGPGLGERLLEWYGR